jgi:hypothetical protein
MMEKGEINYLFEIIEFLWINIIGFARQWKRGKTGKTGKPKSPSSNAFSKSFRPHLQFPVGRAGTLLRYVIQTFSLY